MSSEPTKVEVTAEQQGMSREEVLDLMSKTSEHAIDLENLPKQGHHWVDRGLKVSCEGGAHLHHSHFKTQR